MPKKQTFILLAILLISVNLYAQNCTSERYLSDIFQSSVSQDVVFGNSPALTAVYVAENVTVNQAMTMDIFFPVGDNLPKRPLVILAYGGGYLFGTKDDEDVWATCDSLAKKGYVTASINYRMNMNVASGASAIRAIYRATQDYSSAIRYLKEYSNTYGIDTNYVFVGGVSAGGFSAMHAVFLDDNERPSETFQSGLLGGQPDLGCVNCAGNPYQHSTSVRGIINLWGALMDTNYIQQNEIVPMALFHGTDDLIVPYDYGFPFTALFLMPEVFGSENIAARVNYLGGNAEMNTFSTGHNIWALMWVTCWWVALPSIGIRLPTALYLSFMRTSVQIKQSCWFQHQHANRIRSLFRLPTSQRVAEAAGMLNWAILCGQPQIRLQLACFGPRRERMTWKQWYLTI